MKIKMKTMPVLATAFTCALAAGMAAAQDVPKMKMTTPIPAEITTPDTVESRIGTLTFNDGFPSDETVQKVYDNLAFQRGVSVFLSATGGSSTEGLRQGLASIGVDNNQTVALFEDLMDSKSLFLTPNTESIYSVMWVDVKDGPVVLETPPDVLGLIDDHWFHYVADFGRVGPDKGQGGKFLLVPPGYKGDIPEGYFVYHTKTYGHLVFWRGFIKDGSTASAVAATKKHAKIYSLKDAANPPPMKFINASGKHFNTIGAGTFKFYEDINNIVQYEPNEAFNPAILGQLAALGIEKGKEFNPDERMKKILTEAAAVGDATARALVFKYPEDIAYYPGSAWVQGFVGDNYKFQSQPGVDNTDALVHMLFYATGVTPAMSLKILGKGSQYALAFVDSDGKPMDGSKTYKIHLPPNVPAKDFWSFVVYDNQTRSMLQTDQQYPSISSEKKGIVTNPDGSVDIWFGPTAPKGHEANWVQTVPGKGWSTALRLYGPEEAWFDKTWRPSEIELVE
ncbi:DUF1254 domain-containing protein [Pseudomonas sp. EA_105y_Pfl2_R69]|uniref:DUF1254 domain-containing protein n=1 Tax=Pseudomonas sp. EA_105y_Pfl2_R69 TaxID=3088683 RepID=UPI0030DC0A3E